MVRANFHTHSCFCDGTGTPEEIANAAMEAGLDHLGFSGHVDISPVMDVPAYLAEVRRIQEKFRGKLDILCGGELDNMYPDRSPRGFDYLIGSVHHMKAGNEVLAVDWTEEIFLHLLNDYYGGDGYLLCRDYFRLVAATYGRGKCDFVGHFDLVTKFNSSLHFVNESDPRYLKPAMEALEYLAREDLPLEINTKLAEKGKIFPGSLLLKRLKELGGRIIFSSDAHRASDLLHGFSVGIALAKECGFDRASILSGKTGKAEFIETPI